MVSFIHCADLHLDKTFSHGNFRSVQKRKADLQERFIESILFALEVKPDFFLIAGDIFDKVSPTNDARIFFADQIRKLKDNNIEPILIGGNHDIPKYQQKKPMAIDILQTVNLATVFDSRTKFSYRKFTKNNKEIVIYGKSFDPTNERINPLRGFDPKIKGDFNILMFHGTFQGKSVKPTIPDKVGYNPFNETDVKKCEIDYIALGHYHNYFALELENGTTIGNPGSLERFTFVERKEEKGFLFVELDKTGPTTNFIRVNARSVAEKSIILDTSIDNINEFIETKISSISDPDLVLRVKLKGTISIVQLNELDLPRIMRNLSGTFFSLEIDRTELELEELGKIFLSRIERPMEAFEKALNQKIQSSNEKNERMLYQLVKKKGLSYFQQLGD